MQPSAFISVEPHLPGGGHADLNDVCRSDSSPELPISSTELDITVGAAHDELLSTEAHSRDPAGQGRLISSAAYCNSCSPLTAFVAFPSDHKNLGPDGGSEQ